MDRREALKKLGAGSAIAVAGPVLLPTFNVAHAASGATGETGLEGVPESGQEPAWYPVAGTGSSAKREVTIVFDNSAISCVDGSAPEFSVQWRVASVSFDSSGPKPVRLSLTSGGSELASTPLVDSQYSGGGYGAVGYVESFTMQKFRSNGKEDKLRTSDVWQLVAMCRWHCPGASEDVVAEYSFSGSANSAPSVSNLFWDDTAPA